MSESTAKKEKNPKYKFIGKKPTLTRKIQAIKLLGESFFNVSWVCGQIGIQRRSFLRWRELDPEFERACIDVQEGIYDEAELYLQKKIRDNDTASLIFFLKTKCKQRGYVEKKEVEYMGEARPAVFNLIEKSAEEIKHERSSDKPEAKGNASSPK